jgi:membrane peptidoglycan carboxypeptidase
MIAAIHMDRIARRRIIYRALFCSSVLLPFTFLCVIFFTSFARAVSRPIRECGSPLAANSIPRSLVLLVLSQEDRLFFEHAGIDWSNVWYALKIDLKNASLDRGASTLPMQVSSLCYRKGQKENDRTILGRWVRKIQEVADAYVMVLLNSRAEILRAYLTLAPMGTDRAGNQIVGFPEASLAHFNRPLTEIAFDKQALLVRALLTTRFLDLKRATTFSINIPMELLISHENSVKKLWYECPS